MTLRSAIGAVVDGWDVTCQTPLSGHLSPVRAVVPIGLRTFGVAMRRASLRDPRRTIRRGARCLIDSAQQLLRECNRMLVRSSACTHGEPRLPIDLALTWPLVAGCLVL